MDSVCLQLCSDIKNNCIEKVEAALRDHPDLDINWEDDEGWTVLHFASYWGRTEIVKLLLDHPFINVNVQMTGGATPFLLCCLSGEVEVVQMLLKDRRVDITLDDNCNCHPLWCASYNGRLEVVELLIASGRDLGNLNLKGRDGYGDGKDYTALEIARKRVHTEIVSLIERFIANPIPTRHQILMKLGLPDALAAEVFALIVFICDDLLQLKETSTLNQIAAIRFFEITLKLPMEVQMIVCCRVVGLMKQNIRTQDSEPAFKSLVRTLFLPQD
jgi:hypothetical protein